VRARALRPRHALKSTALSISKALRKRQGDYLETLSANTRQQIRRAVRLYEARGPLVLEAARSVGGADWFERMGVLHEAAWRARGRKRRRMALPLPARLSPPGDRAELSPRGGDRPHLLRRRGVGYVHCLMPGGWIGSYLSGFAYEADNKVKPGWSASTSTSSTASRRRDVLDFLAGDHRYKTSLGSRARACTGSGCRSGAAASLESACGG
jgi:hypothetical protein